MVTAESLRHFVAEWIKIDPPKRKVSQYPWGKRDLYLLNLYTLSAQTYLTEMPLPFISLLFDQEDVEAGEFISEDRRLYRGYFKNGSFMLPRRYLLDGSCNSETAFHTNRYHFTSDGYGTMASDWRKPDLSLIRFMQTHDHVRRHMLTSPECEYLYRRLTSLAQRHEIEYRYSPNLLDFTSYARQQIEAHEAQAASETMLIQAPIVGLLDKVRRRAVNTIINGALVVIGKESVEMALETEPCFKEYITERAPFKEIRGHHVDTSAANATNLSIVYIVAEVPGGIFEFKEFNPKTRMTIQQRHYFRVLSHTFTCYPEVTKGGMEMRLKHFINEGLIPDTPRNKQFLTKRNSALFGLSDIPKGYKTKGNTVMGPEMRSDE